VITPLLSKQFWINLPHQEERNEPTPPAGAADDRQPVLLSVDAEGVIRINREAVPKTELSRRVRRVLAARGDRNLFFDAADGADFALAVEAMDLARGGGATTIAVLTKSLGR
jgi:biopolymer transport protein ExbD/biopolymer transport protein TolR